MTAKYVGKRILRNEDPRLLTGQALFVDGCSRTTWCGGRYHC
ncbi:MAG: hypothetical protein P8X95_21715 [Anaerolineales bacterium]